MRQTYFPIVAIALMGAVAPMRAHATEENPRARDEDDLPDPGRPLADLPTYESPIPDLMPMFVPMVGAATGRGAIGLNLSLRLAEGRRDYGGGVFVELPIDGWVGRKAKTGDGKRDPFSEAPANQADDEGLDDAVSADPSVDVAPRRSSEGLTLPVVRPSDARAAIASFKKHRGAALELEELDALAARARYSALLPTLRVRATRLVDESVSLSPTSYDADRTTSRGGASLWLEARASWNLDRLVFASEEVRVNQLQHDAAEDEERAARQVTERLFAWQRAVYAMYDPTLQIHRCVQAWLDTQELAAALDIATGGWFSGWSAKFGVLRPSCVEAFEGDAQLD
jgi:hypothetical protein